MCLWFISSESQADADDDADAPLEQVIFLDETVKFRRLWSHDFAASLPREHGSDFLDMVGANVLCYQFTPSTHQPATAGKAATGGGFSARPLLLTFSFECARHAGADERLSAEAFEALLSMAVGTCKTQLPKASPRGGGPSSRSTTKTVPLATTYDPARPAPLVAAMSAAVGPLVGPPNEADDDAALAGLITPVRGLNIS